jgi:effector-binding domain-containing protein
MLDALHVTDSPALLAAVIRFKIPQMELPSVMGPAVDELMAALKAQGITPAGPLFNHYLSMDSGMFDFEVGVPVSTPVARAGRVVPGELPAAKVVRATYHGPYAGLHHAWCEFGELGQGAGAQTRRGHLGMLRLWPGVEPGPDDVADGAEPARGRVAPNFSRIGGNS